MRVGLMLTVLLLTGCADGSRKALATLDTAARAKPLTIETILPICRAGLVDALNGNPGALGEAIDSLPEQDRANAGTVCAIFIEGVGAHRTLIEQQAMRMGSI